jgi:hypothetical protein
VNIYFERVTGEEDCFAFVLVASFLYVYIYLFIYIFILVSLTVGLKMLPSRRAVEKFHPYGKTWLPTNPTTTQEKTTKGIAMQMTEGKDL